jgi:hypothetical protein
VRVRCRAAAIAAVALACGGEDLRRSPAEPAVRIWNPTVVRWEAGRPRHVDFAIENPTNRTLEIAEPDPASARVDVYAGPETFRVCGVAPSAAAAPAPARRLALGPGDRVAVRVELDRACGSVPPGEYRYVVSYETSYVAAKRAPRDDDRDDRRDGKDAKAVKDAFLGMLPPQYGQLLVAAEPAGVVCAPPDATPEQRPEARPGRHGRAAREADRAPPARRGRGAPAEGGR